MTDNHLTLFCLVDGEATQFSMDINSTKTVNHLKDAIKAKNSPRFDDIAADELTLRRVSLQLTDGDDQHPILLSALDEKKKLGQVTRLSKVFTNEMAEETIHIIVQRPPPGNFAFFCFYLTRGVSGSLN